ncbi:MAG: GNAT family N-acetyltransferase [Bdellovibrionota bacterium]
MRHTFPSFLMMRAFIVGSPLAISSDSLGVTQLSGAQLAQLLPEIKAMILSKANELRSHFAVLKELTAEKIALIRDGLAPEFVFVPSMPGSSIRLADPMKRTFETRLRSKYRSLMQQRKALFQRSGAKWELYENFSPIASEMHSLYENVLDKSKTKFEILTPEFFASLSEQLKQNAIVLLARREGAPLAFGLILFSRCHANLIYVGLDYASRDETASYYNIFYRAIEEAESRGCETISVGQTTYESKAILGATFFNLTLGLAPLTRLSKFLISRFSSALFPVIETPERRVFKNFPRN